MSDGRNWRSAESSSSSTFPGRIKTTNRTAFGRGNSRIRPNQEPGSSRGNGTSRKFSTKTETQNNEREQHRREVRYRFKKLEELSETDPLEIVVELTGNQSSFEQLLDSELTNDSLVLVIKILAKICLSDLVNTKALIANLASKENFHKSLQRFVLDLMVQTERERRLSSYYWKDPDKFFIGSRTIFLYLIKSVPSKACDILPKTLNVFKLTLATLNNETMKDLFGQLEKELELCKIERKKQSAANTIYDGDDQDEDPPDDFRCLSVYPTSDDINLEPEYIRKNVIDKSYKGVNHYLDVQFRLLREDFIGPLRDGIAEFKIYTGSKPMIKTSGARVYTKVQFLSPKMSQGQIGVLLQFQSIHQKRIRNLNLNKTNKMFMYGSLLCFSQDNFQSSFFGKVMERSTELLSRGQVVVGLQSNQQKYFPGQSYVMVECSVYFEPYYHVLRALQNMDEEKFPMKKYIIDLDPEIENISYLTTSSVYEIGNYQVPLYDRTSWPNANALELNPSQYLAFQTALTKELVVIQGPPGTGKTFLGLKIARTLIENKLNWYRSSPILVVCFTNHALDQFLEGLQNATSEIVRVGGQSKNEDMEKFSLRKKRSIYKRSVVDCKAMNAVETKVNKCLSEISSYSDILKDIENRSTIVNFKLFLAVEPNLSSSWFFHASDEDVVEWLLKGRNSQERVLERDKIKRKELEEDQLDDKNNDLHTEFDEILYKEVMEKYEIDDEMDVVMEKNTNHCLLSISGITARIETMKREETNTVEGQGVFNHKLQLQKQRFELEDQLIYLKMRFEEFQNVIVRNKPQHCNLQNPHKMSADDRWQLYQYWVNMYKVHLTTAMERLYAEYKTVEEEYNEIKTLLDLQVMKKMDVVGMTTTGAARLQTVIKNLESPIVIVEEAAEVLESHVVVSLTQHCRHLILIGDHQQLRPSTSNYYVEKKLNLGISLFERMVRNKLDCHVLDVQHRMRPEIARLIVPAIYPTLNNHPSVYTFPSIMGIVHNLYFIDHSFEEQETGDSSKLNQHEAKFLISLARYLIQNGYKPEDVTILAAYSGQMFALWKEQKECLNLVEGVRITVLDNYQGEESKIILLSLVRNNDEGKIGFLKIENRVCVALSRAREGFYMMGNMDLLCRKSEIWPKIRTVLQEQNSLGSSLLLKCQIHPEQETRITLPRDFSKVPEGGCSRGCNAQLICGHNCTMVCHVLDRDHTNFNCKANCFKTLCEYSHPCPNFCYEKCQPCVVPVTRNLDCGHKPRLPCHIQTSTFNCPTPMRTVLPCGHTDPKKPCYISIDSHKCPFPCDTRVEPCGHACAKMCHYKDDPDHLSYKCEKSCEKCRTGCSTKSHKCPNKCYEKCATCDINVKKRRSCTHKVLVACTQNPDDTQCTEYCKRKLSCGHNCKNKCHEPCGNCNEMVFKEVSVCKHKIKIRCSDLPNRQLCKENCPLQISCGHKCKNKCNEPCTTDCKELVSHTYSAACGHNFQIECNMKNTKQKNNSINLLRFCTAPCRTTLSCSHMCSGTCGECAQGRIHKTCTEKCGAVLVCGHPCSITCREACQPCERDCSYKCEHSACKKKCGEPCTECREKCSRKCPHAECEALCGEKCTIPPCVKPCQKKLSCGHECVGFCGDPCPLLCRICDNDELSEIFFGDEDEDDARFVMLDECQHTLESKGMEMWLREEVKEQKGIAPKSCPKCKTLLTSTQRYSDYIKEALLNLSKVKVKYFGTPLEIDQRRQQLILKCRSLFGQLGSAGTIFRAPLETFEKALDYKSERRYSPSMALLTTYNSKIQIFENILSAYKQQTKFTSVVIDEYATFLLKALTKNEKRITLQEILDFEREVKRLSYQCQLVHLIEKDGTVCELTLFKEIEDLFSPTVFTDDFEKVVANNIKELSMRINQPLTKVEFEQVVRAMNMGSGHWFECPNGHIYAIGECGGAMERGICVECKEAIGGTSHSLLASNRHSNRPDGSRFAAYSEAANNLFNYEEFRDFH